MLSNAEGPEHRFNGPSLTPSLKALSDEWLSQICRVLIQHKVAAEKNGYQAEDESVTAERIREFIEEDFAEDEEFMGRWPSDVEGGLDSWLESWNDQWEEDAKWGYGMRGTGNVFTP